MFDLWHVMAMLTAVSFVGFTGFTAFAVYSARRRIRPNALVSPRAEGTGSQPGVSIMKPCAGADDDLESCLESYCALRYPTYQIVFGVRDANDAAYPIIARVRARHPEVDIAVVLAGEGRHPSPKVSNLEAMAPHAKYELYWLSDSNTRVHSDTLTSMVEEIAEPGVGAVVSPIVGDEERSVGSAIENVHLNGFVAAGGFVALPVTGLAAFPGKSVLLKRDKLNALGSWEELGRYAGEDIILFKRIAAMGLRLTVGRHIVTNVSQHTTVQKFIARHVRWAQIRWRTVTPSTIFEPLLSPWLTALAFAALSPSRVSLITLIIGAALQGAGDFLVIAVVRGRPLPLRFAWVIWVRPFLSTWVWLRALFVSRFEWRGNTFWMGPESVILSQPPLRSRLRSIRATG